LEQREIDRVARLLEAEGRALTPPPGALRRVIARASAPRQPQSFGQGFAWLRPAVAALTVVVLLIGLGGGAYASSPGDTLFSVQRALDDVYLALPRTPQGAAQASIGVAERRVGQAARVQATVSASTLRATLGDALRYFAASRAAIGRMPEGQRQHEFKALAAAERAARDRLVQARHEPNGQNNDVLDEVTSVLEQEANHDADDGQQGPGSQNRAPQPQPGASTTDDSPEQGTSEMNLAGANETGAEGTAP
jgi:hypothetical protein